MATYSHIFGSQFPSELIALGTHKDVDDSIVSLVNQYNSYIDSEDMTSAYNLYTANKDKLDPYLITMQYINYLEEEIYNTGIAALTQYQVTTSETEPIVDTDEGTYWIQEYE